MNSPPRQPYLPTLKPDELDDRSIDRENNWRANKLNVQDRAFHDWYRFVLSFPPHLVRDYVQDFGLSDHQVILDPFCGTGTTIVEAKKQGIRGIGVEANPFPQFACSVKVDWNTDPDALIQNAREVAEAARWTLQEQGIDDRWPFRGNVNDLPLRKLDPKAEKLLITNSISPLPLHKALVLLDCLHEHLGKPTYRHAVLAFANALVFSISNLRFGPEVGVGKVKEDTPVISAWLAEVDKIAGDLRKVHGQLFPEARIHLDDARNIGQIVPPGSVDAVITSPPYPNEKDYTRTTRLESVVLGFIKSSAELRAFKKSLLRSNTRGVYKDDQDDAWIANHGEIQRIADEIEKRRVDLGKTSGFEKMYAHVTRQYFGGMARHFADLRTVLRPGARLAYVVGDQASYLRIMIRTGQLLAEIAQSLGYEVVRIDLFRTRFATATKEELREEVVVLRWPG